ncbi:MAG: hypothetical protein ACE5IL_06125 [Myxococcota bacterium]
MRGRARQPLLAWGLATLAAALLGAAVLVAVRTRVTDLRYRLSARLEELRKLEPEVERLRIEAAALQAPERIEPRARALGLRYPEPGQVRRLEAIVDVAAGGRPAVAPREARVGSAERPAGADTGANMAAATGTGRGAGTQR